MSIRKLLGLLPPIRGVFKLRRVERGLTREELPNFELMCFRQAAFLHSCNIEEVRGFLYIFCITTVILGSDWVPLSISFSVQPRTCLRE